MQVKKLGVAVAALACGLILAACGNSSSSSSNKNETFNYVYPTDPTTLDYTTSYRQSDQEQLANFEDGLMENDQYGRLKPDLAKSYKVSDGGKVYTYTLRKGVKWVDSEGNTYGTVKAQDFVTGLKHAVDAKSEMLYVVQDSIKGLNAYATGKTKDFSKVGVKAIGKYKVRYTLNQPESYWNSKLTYGVMYPINAKFLKAEGKNFGKMKPNNILYNGPYILTNFTSKSVITYKANSSYWDKKNVHIKKVKLTYNDGSNPDQLYKSFEKGTYSEARVYPNSAGYKNVLKNSKNNIVWSDSGATTYNFTFNLNRQNYDATSKKTDQEKNNTKKAILNRYFRLAIQFAFDKTAYNAQNVGSAGAKKSLRNMLTPPNFVTVNGKSYGSYVQSDLQSEDSSVFKGIDLADGQDGTYNPTKAKELFAKAKKQLQAEGVSFPVKLDLPADQKSQITLNQAKSFKKSVESVLGKDNVEIDIQMLSEAKYLAGTYQAETGKQSDFDISNASGWGPDYTDPSTYLDIYNPTDGSMLMTIGIDSSKSSQDVAKEVGLDQYAKLVEKAEAITNNDNARYQAFAKAEAYLLNTGIQIPTYSDGGTPSVTKVVPRTSQYSWTGLSEYRYKYMKLQSKPVTTKQYNKATQAWEKQRAKIAKENSNN